LVLYLQGSFLQVGDLQTHRRLQRTFTPMIRPSAEFNSLILLLNSIERAISEQIDKILKANKEHFKRYKTKDEDLKKKHRRLHKKLLEVREELKKLNPPKTAFIG